MTITETDAAREFIQKISPINEEFMRSEAASDIQTSRVARLIGSSMIEFVPKQRELVSTVLAAELFPDYEEPILEIADDEADKHDILRQRHPSSKPRLSAELYMMKNFPNIRFLSLDCVDLARGITTLRCDKNLSEIVEWLLDQNIIPTDANCRIIPEAKNIQVEAQSTGAMS